MLTPLESRVTALEARQLRHENRLDGVDAALEVVGVKLDDASAHAREFRSETGERLGGIDARLDGIDARLDGLGGKLDRLTGLVEQLLQR